MKKGIKKIKIKHKNKSKQKINKVSEEVEEQISSNPEQIIKDQKNEFKNRIEVKQEDKRTQNLIIRKQREVSDLKSRIRLLKSIQKLEEQNNQQDDEEINQFFRDIKQKVNEVEKMQIEIEKAYKENAKNNKKIKKNKVHKKRICGTSFEELLLSENFIETFEEDEERV